MNNNKLYYIYLYTRLSPNILDDYADKWVYRSHLPNIREDFSDK